MPDFSIFNADQRKVLLYSYNRRRRFTHSDIEKHCCKIHPNDLNALCTEKYHNALKRTISRLHGDMYEISPSGRGICEALQKQQSDEAYQKSYNDSILFAAQEANTHAKRSNILSAIALLISAAAIVISVISLIRG